MRRFVILVFASLCIALLSVTMTQRAQAQGTDLGTVNFAFDSAALDAAARTEIARIATQLRERGGLSGAVVVGYTDAVGSSGYNDGLGLRRARAVADALVAQGVPVARIGTVASRGERDLLVAVATPERANRRVRVSLGQMMAACRTWREVPLTNASLTTTLESDMRSRLDRAIAARSRFATQGTNGPAYQMAAAARSDCATAYGYVPDADRKLEYVKRCVCSSARLDVALR